MRTVEFSERRSAVLKRSSFLRSGRSTASQKFCHSASEMVDYEDLKNSVKLLTAMLSKPVSF